MSLPRVSANPPLNVDPLKASPAYGVRALPKLNEEITDSSAQLVTRQKALNLLTEMLHSPNNIIEAIRIGIITSLKSRLADEDNYVRIKATENLLLLSNHAKGRDALLENNIIEPISVLFEDAMLPVRTNVHSLLEMLTRSESGAVSTIHNGLISRLVECLTLEEHENQLIELILSSLFNCMKQDTCDALKCQAMESFINLLNHPKSIVRGKAAEDIMSLSFPLQGKKRAVECGAVPLLVNMLRDVESFCRAKASGALMAITVTTQGKKEALKHQVINKLTPLFCDPTPEVQLNAIKFATTVGEDPEGRQLLNGSVEKLRDIANRSADEYIRRAAEVAVSVLTWKP